MENLNEMIKKARAAASAEELKKLALEEGLEFTAEEAEKVFSYLNGHKEMTDEELLNVAGGVKFRIFSIENCPKCGYWEFMLDNDHYDKCPKCGSTRIRRVFGV